MATRTQQIGAFLAPLGVAACSAVGFAVFTVGLSGAGWIDPIGEGRLVSLIKMSVLSLAWAVGAVAIAGSASGLIWRWRLAVGVLVPAGAWAAGTLAACPFLGWNLLPSAWELSSTGPAVAVWLIVGVCALVAPRRSAGGRFGGWWTVPARALVAWAFTYGALWCCLAVLSLVQPDQIGDVILFGLLASTALGTGAALAGAGAAIGPIEPGPQLLSVFIAAAGVPLCLPSSNRQLARVARRIATGQWEMEPILDDLLFPVVMASFAAVAWGTCAVLIWLRSRHHARSVAAQAPNG